MGYPDYERDLKADNFDLEAVLNRYFHSGQPAVFHGANPDEEPRFKRYISQEILQTVGIRCHPLQLVICGSAHLGFSPVPGKLGKSFDSRTSDADIAIVSSELFDYWWTELQECDSLSNDERSRIAEDLFWGFINPSKVFSLTETGDKWWTLFKGFQFDRARAVRGRVYRTYWNMQNYHKHAILLGRDELLEVRN